jgi:hypothetical protein
MNFDIFQCRGAGIVSSEAGTEIAHTRDSPKKTVIL